LIAILLLPAMLLVPLVIAAAATLISNLRGPSDDPALLCIRPDPTPLINASLVLQNCSAGKTFTIQRGEILAVDLTASAGVDTGGEFRDLSVSNGSILATVAAPSTLFSSLRNGVSGRYFDYVALLRGARTGQTMISALVQSCFNTRCQDTNRWVATVRVT